MRSRGDLINCIIINDADKSQTTTTTTATVPTNSFCQIYFQMTDFNDIHIADDAGKENQNEREKKPRQHHTKIPKSKYKTFACKQH